MPSESSTSPTYLGNLSDEEKVYAAARIYTEFFPDPTSRTPSTESPQQALMRILNLTQSTASRLLKRAEDTGVLRQRPWVDSSRLDITVDRRAFIKKLITQKETRVKLLTDKVSEHLREVRIIDFEYERNDGDYARFAWAVAGDLHREFRNKEVRTVGVTWGRAIGETVDALARSNPDPRPELTCVPTAGDPLGYAYDTQSSTVLARKLSQAMRSGDQNQYSLTGVPAFIPLDFLENRSDTAVRKLIRRVPGYELLFEGKDPILPRLDILLTSVGSAETALGFSNDRFIDTAGIKRDDIRQTVIGDIGGILLKKPGLRAKRREQLESWGKAWTGMSSKHLDGISQRSVEKKRPGVIVLAFAPDLADVLIEAVRLNFVNKLYVGRKLNETINKRLKAG